MELNGLLPMVMSPPAVILTLIWISKKLMRIDCYGRLDPFLPERHYVMFGSLLSQFSLSACRL